MDRIKISFSKKECQEIAKLIKVLRNSIPQKKANEKRFFADIMAPSYEWAVFFENSAKG